jgi:hypothetical protein
VKDDRPVPLAVLADILELELLREVEVDLDGGDRLLPAQHVA